MVSLRSTWPVLFGSRAAALLVLTASASAQWSTDAALNVSVADGASDQTQPKVVATSDGGCYLSWFDGIGTGFDVRLQKLDAAGNELFPHNGVLVADRAFSSTQDYGLDVDSAGNALLTYRDTIGGTQISASKVSPTGTLLWGATGVQLTATGSFVAAPKIAGASDGSAFVAWTQDATTRVQRLDAAGVAAWGADVVLTAPVGSYSVSDMHDAGTTAILSFVHQSGGFGSPRHIYAQKFDTAGALQWGATHVPVFDGGSVQFGNFPTFVPDGAGGAAFTWYDTATFQFQCYVQRLDTSGIELFPHNGVGVSSNNTRTRVDPSLSFDSLTNNCLVFWREQSGALDGVYGQLLAVSGATLWGAEGVVVVPLGATELGLVRSSVDLNGGMAFWSSATGPTTERLFGAHVNGFGVIDVPTFDVATTVSTKSRLAHTTIANGDRVLAWMDSRVDASDIYMQNVNPDGSLGLSAGISIGCDPANPHFLGGPATLATSSLGSGVGSDLHIECTDGPAGEFGFILVSPSGTSSLSVFGGVLCLDNPQGRYNPQVATNQGLSQLNSIGQFDGAGVLQSLAGNAASSGGSGFDVPSELPFSPPGQFITSGSTYYFQAWFRDQVAVPGDSANFSNMIEVQF
jgi:hypothetical protein